MQLKKYGLNLISVTALGIGSVVGAGIFALLGQVIMMAGDQTYYAFIIAGVAALFSGYSYSRLAAAYPDSGGLTDYFHIAFKKRWVVGTFSLIYMMTSAVSICMMAKSFGIYAVKLFPHVQDTNFFINTAACFLMVGLAALNMQRSKDVGNTEIVMVSIKMGILLSLIIAALIHYDIAEKMQTIPFNEVKFMGSIGVTFFAFAGYGVITNAAGDVKNPQRTITWGIFLTILIVIGLYLALAFVALHFIPAKELMANADIAVAVAANRLMGDWGYALMYITAVIAFISGIGATYFSIFRISYALSQQHILPEFYHRRFWQRGTWGNLLTVLLMLAATLWFDFNQIVNLSSAAYLISYLAVFSANWILRRETKSSPTMIVIGIGLMLFIFLAFMASLVIEA